MGLSARCLGLNPDAVHLYLNAERPMWVTGIDAVALRIERGKDKQKMKNEKMKSEKSDIRGRIFFK